MGKPNLVIDEEKEKIFLDGEFIGTTDKNNFEVATLDIKRIDKFSNLKPKNIFNDNIVQIDILLNDKSKFYVSFCEEPKISISYFSGVSISFYIDMLNWSMAFSLKSFKDKLFSRFLRYYEDIDPDNYVVYLDLSFETEHEI